MSGKRPSQPIEPANPSRVDPDFRRRRGALVRKIVCEDCQREQRIDAFDVDPVCERCGSATVTQVGPADVA